MRLPRFTRRPRPSPRAEAAKKSSQEETTCSSTSVTASALHVWIEEETHVAAPLKAKLPDPSFFSSNHVLVNRERAKRGIRPVQRCHDLDELARHHARHMAASRTVQHSVANVQELQDLLMQRQTEDEDTTSAYYYVGENIQIGKDIRSMHASTMDAVDCVERRNILAGHFDQFGMGTAIGVDPDNEDDEECLYMVQYFRSSEPRQEEQQLQEIGQFVAM
jgi:uncharacterized protein YkwD